MCFVIIAALGECGVGVEAEVGGVTPLPPHYQIPIIESGLHRIVLDLL